MLPDIILVGASVRSLAESAVRDGLVPFCVDMFGDADLLRLLDDVSGEHRNLFRQIASFDQTPDALRDVPPNVPLLVTGGIENDPDLLRTLAQSRPLLGPPPDVISDLRNPTLLFPTLEHNGVAVPTWQSAVDGHNFDEHRWLQKSFRSAGGQGVSWLVGNTTAKSQTELPQRGSYLQRFLSGPTMSATFFATGQSAPELIGVSLQISGASEVFAPEFHFAGNLGPLTVADQLRRQIEHAGQVITKQWAVTGLFGIDFVVHDDRALVLEVNPRVTASHELYELSNAEQPGHVAMQRTATAPQAARASFPPRTRRGVGNAGLLRLVVYADEGITLTERDHQKMLQKCCHADQPLPPAWLADIPQPGARVPAQTPLCSVYLGLEKGATSQNLGHPAALAAVRNLVDVLPLQTPPKVESLLRRLQVQMTLLETDRHLP